MCDLTYFDSSEISHGTRVKVIHLDSRFYNLQQSVQISFKCSCSQRYSEYKNQIVG
jgi:hypothetical protein